MRQALEAHASMSGPEPLPSDDDVTIVVKVGTTYHLHHSHALILAVRLIFLHTQTNLTQPILLTSCHLAI